MTRLPHWQVMEEYRPDLLAKVEPWRLELLEGGALPRKTKELMMVAMCAVTRFHAGIRIHAEYAIDAGASDTELVEACALSQLIGGVPAYRESVLLVKELIDERSNGAGPG